MNINGEHSYTLQITGDTNRIIEAILSGDLATTFHQSLKIKNIPKLYIVHQRNKINYVGYAGKPFAAILKYGLNPKSSKGYAGYKWRHEEEVAITIFTFATTNTAIKDAEKRLFVEAVEAKIVYGIRNRTGRWPEYQNEIHFSNSNTAEVRICAEKILDKIFKVS
jgi:hypothetical protein